MQIESFRRKLDTAFRLRERMQQLKGKVQEEEDVLKHLSKKDQEDLKDLMNSVFGGGFGSLPPMLRKMNGQAPEE